MIWIILGVALIAGMIGTSRVIRPRGFGGMRGRFRTEPSREPGPNRIVSDDEFPYMYPNQATRPRSRPRSLT
jgi:hypothetical protein